MNMILWQRLEGLAVALACGGALWVLPVSWPWWIWPLAVLAPDLSMLGYLGGPRLGAAAYNLAHSYGTGALLVLVGLVWTGVLVPVGLVLLVHAGADRALGFGLKAPTAFRDTHLGRLGGGR